MVSEENIGGRGGDTRYLAAHLAAWVVVVLLAFAAPALADDVSPHGGPVQHDPTLYAIFWLPSGTHFGEQLGFDDSDYENWVVQWLKDSQSTNLANVVSQYYDGNGPILPGATFGATWTDTTAYPQAGTAGDPLQDKDMQASVARAIAANHWPEGVNSTFFVFTGKEVNFCLKSDPFDDCTPEVGSTNTGCGYHSSYQDLNTPASDDVVYAVLSDLPTMGHSPDGHFCVSPDDLQAPYKSGGQDLEISALAHEQFEAETDPLPFREAAWTATPGDPEGEIGDPCHTDYGTASLRFGTLYNYDVDGNLYRIQDLWSQLDGGCSGSDLVGDFYVNGPFVASAGRSTGTLTLAQTGDSPNVAGAPAPTIDWGDGTAADTVTLAGGCTIVCDLSGSHTYADLGTYTVTLTYHVGCCIARTTTTYIVVWPLISVAATNGLRDWHKDEPLSMSVTAFERNSTVSSLDCTDEGSFIRTFPRLLDESGIGTHFASASFAIFGEGTHVVSCEDADAAGDPAQPGSATIRIDSVAPTDTPVASGTLGNNGWYTSPVTVNWHWSDLTSGIDANDCPQTVSSNSGSGGDGPAITLSGHCTDVAGNKGSASLAFEIDRFGPVDAPVVSGIKGSNGWYTSPVSVAWHWSDGVSGIDPSHCTQTTGTSGDGKAVTVTSTCRDLAGNTTTDSRSFPVDVHPPKDAPVVTGTKGDNGWYTSDVSVAWNWTDAASGVDTANCTQFSSTTGEGRDVRVSSSCRDLAGNGAGDLRTFNIDKTKPVVQVTGVSAGGSYVIGTASPGCSTTDALSGVAVAATVSLSGGPIGKVTAMCSGAKDNAGNTAAGVSVTYTVIKASPVLITTASPGVSLGGTIHGISTLSGGYQPTGTLTFDLYGPGATPCVSDPLSTSTVSVHGNGGYVSADFTPLVAGTYHWIAFYPGDGNNFGASVICNGAGGLVTVTATATKATPALTTQASPHVTRGGSVWDTATLSGGTSPTGTIIFKLYNVNDPGCTGTPVYTSTVVVTGNGNYTSANFVPANSGTYHWVASYTGDASDNAAADACGATGESVSVSGPLIG